jgi:exosortase A-associated hydrolase 1
MMSEQAVIFRSGDKQLVAIEHLAEPNTLSHKGVVIVVGGPQTRVGSHRLFVYLARALASAGVSVFRFDYTGAGDSEGDITDFTNIQGDIDAAMSCFLLRNPQVTELSLWGLCDAASAILLYLQQYPDQQKNITDLVLVNPWVRQVHTEAKAYLHSYYVKRFFSKKFWQKLLTGKVKTNTAFSEIKQFRVQSKETNNIHTGNNFVAQMRQGLEGFVGQSHVLLSGNDLTADEFQLLVKSNKHWRILMKKSTINLQCVEHADHTFSQIDKQNRLIALTCKALAK